MALKFSPDANSAGASEKPATSGSGTLIAGTTLPIVSQHESTMPSELKKSGPLVDQ